MNREERVRQRDNTAATPRTVSQPNEPSSTSSLPTAPLGGRPTQPTQSSGSSVLPVPADSGQPSGDRARDVQEKGQQKAGALLQQAQQKVQPQLEGQKQKAAGTLDTVAQALRETSDRLRQEEQGSLGQVSDRGAEQLDRLSAYLRQNDVNRLVGDVEQFARRQPALFLGGAFALGLLASRFLKSSRQQSDSRDVYQEHRISRAQLGGVQDDIEP